MSCIYRRSQHYINAKADPLKVIQPLGYVEHHVDKPKDKSSTANRSNVVVNKIVCENTLQRQISAKAPFFKDVERFLKISDFTQRKTYCLNGVNLDFASKVDKYTME
jgi:hypothetical protein